MSLDHFMCAFLMGMIAGGGACALGVWLEGRRRRG